MLFYARLVPQSLTIENDDATDLQEVPVLMPKKFLIEPNCATKKKTTNKKKTQTQICARGSLNLFTQMPRTVIGNAALSDIGSHS